MSYNATDHHLIKKHWLTHLAYVLITMACFLIHSTQALEPLSPPQSTIYFAMESRSIDGPVVNSAIVKRMVDTLVCRLTGHPTPSAAWASLVKPTDRVGIKVAASGGSIGGTRTEIVNAVAVGLREAGIPASNIIVWDRNKDDLLTAGFSIDSPNYRLRWTDPDGYDPQSKVTAPVVGRLIWGDSKFGINDGSPVERLLAANEQLSSTSHYSKILSQQIDKVINIPSLMDSFLTGLNGAIANMTIPNIDNWRRFTREPDHGDPYLAEIYADAMIRDKVVLTILDGLRLQYAGGPFPNPGFLLDHHTIFMSRDPVAIDATAGRLIDENRAISKLPSLEKSTRWLESASHIGLGRHLEQEIALIAVPTSSSSNTHLRLNTPVDAAPLPHPLEQKH